MLALLIQLLLIVPALLAVVSAGYLLLLTLLSQSLPIRCSRTRQLRFDVVVPAHNEAGSIGRTVQSLKRLDWPADRFRILVCADNCTDATAENARTAGAEVIERQDAERRGKGYALDFAFRHSRDAGFAEAVAVIDADTEVTPNLLESIAARLENGAQAVQVHYGVLNPMTSWRTRLITIAKGAVHIVRSRARERMGVSCGIRGTGWCVTHRLLQAVPYRAFSLTEDVEYGIDLGLAGYRVAYVDEAHCNGEMASGERNARSQRQRWEQGRFELMRSKTLPLLRAAIHKHSLVCLDLAMDLLVLPLSYVAMIVIALIAVPAVAGVWIPGLQGWWWLGIGCAASIALYVLRGWWLSGIGIAGLFDLACAPVFLLWKLTLLLNRRKSGSWERTGREQS